MEQFAEAVNKHGPMAVLDMDQLGVSTGVPIQTAIMDINKYGDLELYCTTSFHGWNDIQANVADYVKFIAQRGYVTIFGQKVSAYVRRDKAGEIIGFEVRLGV